MRSLNNNWGWHQISTRKCMFLCQSFSSSLLQMFVFFSIYFLLHMFWTGHFFVVGLPCVCISTTGIYLLNNNNTLQVVIIRKCLEICSVHWGYKLPPSSWEPLPYWCMKFYKVFFFESQNNSFACLLIGMWRFSTNFPFLCVSQFIDYKSFLSNKSLRNVREKGNNLN